MKIVSNFNELITNSQTLDGYLRSQVDPEYDFALNLIKKELALLRWEFPVLINFIPVGSLVTLTIQWMLI